ncbi:MAG: hypothetical protein K6F85_06520 [Bacteroidales bacterium]|nr:hypothetical protein [Bacteroidales bacterium]
MKKAVTVITLMLGMTMAYMAQDKFEDADALYNEQGILNMELAPAYNSSGDQPYKNPALAYLF